MNPRQESQRLLTYLQQNGPTPSSELVDFFKISRATLMRRVRALGDSVVTIGKARATQLATRREQVADTPLYQVLEDGRAVLTGQLIPLHHAEHTQWLLRPQNSPPACFEGEFGQGLYPGWPWFLEDLRPSGFLGRAFGKRMAQLFQIDPKPENWNDLELLTTLTQFGSNLSGNFIVGNSHALSEFQRKKIEIAQGDYRNSPPQLYPELARQAINEDSDFGSSAGGEQPKFTTLVCEKTDDGPRAVIVKFSPENSSQLGRRWADLLHAEHLANQVLRQAGFATANTRILRIGARTYLESERFDRAGPLGRRGLVTLRSIDAAHLGLGSGTWADCARKLYEKKWITREDAERMTQLHCFGELIANTDMHWGNLSFFLPEKSPFPLAPVYDMLPMFFRPSSTGEIIEREFEPKLPKPEDQAAWLEMYPHALTYWQRITEHSEITSPFKQIAGQAINALERIHKIATS